jgi:ribosomal protein S18 acetylase RimI-like enzyme
MEPGVGFLPDGDAAILRDAVRAAVVTSPDAFSRTPADVDTKPREYWDDELRSASWAVAEHSGEVVGLAASKRPDPKLDREDPATARYIEQVWVHPGRRRERLGERLVKYLLAAEYLRNHDLRQFLLWVYPENTFAISLYKRIGFEPTQERNDKPKTEIKYRLEFVPEVHTTLRLAAHQIWRHDPFHRRVTYRVLGQPDGQQRFAD